MLVTQEACQIKDAKPSIVFITFGCRYVIITICSQNYTKFLKFWHVLGMLKTLSFSVSWSCKRHILKCKCRGAT